MAGIPKSPIGLGPHCNFKHDINDFFGGCFVLAFGAPNGSARSRHDASLSYGRALGIGWLETRPALGGRGPRKSLIRGGYFLFGRSGQSPGAGL